MHDDPVVVRGVPVSRGVPPAVRVASVIGILLVFVIGAMVIGFATYGHLWPSTGSLRIPLNGRYNP